MVNKVSFSPALDELERIKKLELPYVAEKALIPDLFKSTLAPSSLEKLVHFRPEIPQPLERLLHCQVDACEQSSGWLKELSDDFETCMAKLDLLNRKITEAEEEGLVIARSERKYHTWETALQYGAAAIPLICWGADLFATGGASYFLLAAGGAALINQVMTDTGWWRCLISYCTTNRDEQQIIEGRVQTGLFIASITCAILSGRLAMRVEVFDLAALLREDPLRVLSIMTTFLNAGMKLQGAAIRNESCNLQKRMILFMNESSLIQKGATEKSSHFRKDQTALEHLLSVIQKAVKHLFT